MAQIPAAKMQKSNQTKNTSQLGKALLAQRAELAAKIKYRLVEVIADREPDDEGAIAIDNYSKDLTVATIERERRTLKEIDAALTRLQAGEYGVCAVCGTPIPKVRLEALPWAHMCVNCAERNAA